MGEKIIIASNKAHSCEVNSAQSILAFKRYGVKEMERLFEQFSVNDYSERSQNKYNMWKPGDVIAFTKDTETKFTNLTDKRLYMLIMFCNTKNKNIWVNVKNNRLSIARFFRTAFFASVLKNTNHDIVELSNSIDMESKKRTGY